MNARSRERLAMLSPTALLFVYGFYRANGTMLDRFVEGSFTGIVLGLAVAPVVVVLATAIARGGLLGEKPETGDEFMPHELLPGLLLVAIFWIWWHVDRDRLAVELVECAENLIKYDDFTPSDAVRSCYENPPERVDFEREDGRFP